MIRMIQKLTTRVPYCPLVSAKLQIQKPFGLQTFSVVDKSVEKNTEAGEVKFYTNIRVDRDGEKKDVSLRSTLIRNPIKHLTNDQKAKLLAELTDVIREDWATVLENPDSFTEEKAIQYIHNVVFNENQAPYAILISRTTERTEVNNNTIEAGKIISFTVLTGDTLRFTRYGIVNIGMIRLASTLRDFQNSGLATIGSQVLWSDFRTHRTDGFAVAVVRSFQPPAIAGVARYLEAPFPNILEPNPISSKEADFHPIYAAIAKYIVNERYPLGGDFDEETFVCKNAFSEAMRMKKEHLHSHPKFKIATDRMSSLGSRDVQILVGFAGIGTMAKIELLKRLAPMLKGSSPIGISDRLRGVLYRGMTSL